MNWPDSEKAKELIVHRNVRPGFLDDFAYSN